MSDDTGRSDMQEMTLDLLKEIRDKLSGLEGRQKRVEERLRKLENRQSKVEERLVSLTKDVNIVHKFQKNMTTRLNTVEEYCVERPLHSTPPPPPVEGNGDGR